ncbi:hypothetical protein DL96DRAFT_1553072 [Flagelloscypha sp. PMI_526]|nr:hypothetical protein DL96DRAFT_1553072 [Flagelloscypha sp. PMI_526]
MPSIPGFQSTGFQVLSAAIYLLGISVVSHCLSRRVAVEDWSSFTAIREIKWARKCIILILADSWLFLFSSALLMFGVGLELNPFVCAASIYLCVAFYATSKVLLYLFLVEKVHIVWNPHGADSPRMKSKVFILGIITVSMYLVVIGLMVVGRNHYFRDDGTCIIGLKHYASVTLLAYDLLFLYPLIKTSLKNPRVTRVAIRTLIASAVSLTTSSVNMAVLTLLKGHELGWICLGAGCGVDVIVNACALFWATRGINGHNPGPQSAGTTLTASPEKSMSSARALPDQRLAQYLHRMTTESSPPSSDQEPFSSPPVRQTESSKLFDKDYGDNIPGKRSPFNGKLSIVHVNIP